MFNNYYYINKNIVFFIRYDNFLNFILPLILETRKRKNFLEKNIKK